MDIKTLLEKAQPDILTVMGNPLAQLGPKDKPFLGLQLMPERLVDENQYTETRINYKTFVANHGTKYSPVQIKGGAFVGEFDVKLRSSDIGSELKAQEYDAIIKILKQYTGGDISMQAVASLLRWVDKSIVQPLTVVNEKMVWECIVDALVLLRGDDGFSEDVAISNPTGHRVAALGAWSSDAYDPMDDIYAQAEFLAAKGMQVKRIIAGTPVITKLLKNAKIQAASGGFITVDGGGAIVGAQNRLTDERLNSFFAQNNLPAIEKYDKTYNTQTGSANFLKRDVFVMIAETDNTEEIQVADGDTITIDNTLGYVGVGTNAGESKPGKKIITEAFDRKPPRIEGEGSQESFPVNQNPEAVSVIHSIT